MYLTPLVDIYKILPAVPGILSFFYLLIISVNSIIVIFSFNTVFTISDTLGSPAFPKYCNFFPLALFLGCIIFYRTSELFSFYSFWYCKSPFSSCNLLINFFSFSFFNLFANHLPSLFAFFKKMFWSFNLLCQTFLFH